MIPVVLGVVTLVFFIVRLIPGDPAHILLGDNVTEEGLAAMRAHLGLDESFAMQYLRYLSNMLRFDFGDSLFYKAPVTDVLWRSFPATLELAVCGIIISLLIAVPLGILSAVKQNSWIDFLSMIMAQIGAAMPVFWTGMLMILLFAVHLGWLPSFGRGEPIYEGIRVLITTGSGATLLNSIRNIALPAITLGIVGAALISRMIRSTMLEVLDSDYVRTARAKGTSEFRVIMKHAFRNALLPVVTIVGLQFGNLLGSAIVTETIFSWPGVGRIIVGSIAQRDFPILQGGVILVALSFSIVNLLVDILYAVINPKIRN